jgi:L,D-peptidoglycan transpeptidase YkuD (ErfK/YbiS/YcfS/YnhG family)
MRHSRFRHSALAAFLLLALSACPGGERHPIQSSTQLIVVTTSDWDAVEGTLRRYERLNAAGEWQAVGEGIRVVVGKNGLGWGVGIVPAGELRFPRSIDPVKKEGDGKAPAGIFRLSSTFGYADEKKPEWKMPYISLTQSVVCVDDPASKFYNRILDSTEISQDWNSSEHMQRKDDLYRWGIVVDHNADPPTSGSGSCIFLHVWRGTGEGTVGCTAMPQEQLEAILGWLDPARKPVLVQLPSAQNQRLRQKLNLPFRVGLPQRPAVN